jgi:hypothetical protein
MCFVLSFPAPKVMLVTIFFSIIDVLGLNSGAARRTQETHLRLPFFVKCYNSRVDHTS